MADRTSLAIYLPNLKGGGVERMSILLAECFTERGFDVTFILNQRVGELIPLVPANVKIVTLGANRSMTALPKLAAYLRNERPEILLSSLGHNNIIALWARRIAGSNTTTVICQHNSLINETAALGTWKYRILPSMYRWFARWADGIIAVSKGVADDMAATAGLPRQSISVIYNPVVFADFDRSAGQPLQHPWLGGAAPVFVGIGRLVEQKDFATLINAFARLDPALGARLVILGDGPLLVPLKLAATKLGVADRIEFAGFQQNPLPYLKHATAMVMSSRYEGFGNVLVEAMACGTPVISTDCPFGPSEILENGKFGSLVPVGNAVAMTNAMEKVLSQRLPAEALKQRAADFAVSKIADDYVALLSKLLKTPVKR